MLMWNYEAAGNNEILRCLSLLKSNEKALKLYKMTMRRYEFL